MISLLTLIRFETFQASTTIHRQPLLVPRLFETTPAEETTILSNMKLFEENGFSFVVDHNGPPGNRLKLTTLPFIKSVQFDENDIHEFASLIESVDFMNGATTNGDGSHEVPNLVVKNSEGFAISTLKLPKLVSLLASRACRSAIMVGTSLSINEMRAVVSNLCTIDQPWNCPHGRPTLRYLIDLASICKESDSKKQKFLS